jgi:hypothetical protein
MVPIYGINFVSISIPPQKYLYYIYVLNLTNIDEPLQSIPIDLGLPTISITKFEKICDYSFL